MGLFDSFKSKKNRKGDAAGSAAEELLPLEAAGAGSEPPETRYTPEYQAFLAAQEAALEDGTREAEARGEAAAEEAPAGEYPAVNPEGFCARFERCDSSLIEEPESCDVCVFFCDRDDTCRRPERMQ